MRIYLNAGFGALLGVDMLRELRNRGFAGIRQDFTDPDDASDLCEELAAAEVQPILLIAGGKMGKDGHAMPPEAIAAAAERVTRAAYAAGLFDGLSPAAVEVGNEPDIGFEYSNRPELFADAFRQAHARVRQISPSASIITGGIASTDTRGLSYLEAVRRAGLPADCIIGYHTYRTTSAPEIPNDGFTSRDAEFERLRELADGRPIWCTEAGWHTAPSVVRYGFLQILRRRVQYSDVEVADFARREIEINARHGAIGFTWFQLNDGSNPREYEHRFGIRRLDGQWKPVADALRDVAAALSRTTA